MKPRLRDEISIKARYHYGSWVHSSSTSEAAHALSGAKRALDGALKVPADLHAKIAALAADDRLKDEAKAKDAQAAGAEAVEALRKIRADVSRVSKAREKVRRREKSSDAAEVQLMTFLRLSEIRHILNQEHGADALAMRTAYSAAVASGDFDTCEAIETAPSIWPGKPDTETLALLSAERMAVEDPVLSVELADLTEAESDLVSILNGAEEEVRELSGLGAGSLADGLYSDDAE